MNTASNFTPLLVAMPCTLSVHRTFVSKLFELPSLTKLSISKICKPATSTSVKLILEPFAGATSKSTVLLT